MTPVETNGVAGQQPPHDGGDRSGARLQQKMAMVGDQRPRVASGFGLLENISQLVNKIMTILLVNEYLTAFDTANNNVVQGAGRVNTGLCWNDRKAINLILNSQVYMLRASLSYSSLYVKGVPILLAEDSSI